MPTILSPAPPSSGGGAGGPETDPIAKPQLDAHKAAADPHGAKAAATAADNAHTAAVDPHGDRAAANAGDAAHEGAVDPHGSTAHADAADAAHVAAVDPHGDRAALNAHTAAAAGAHAASAVSVNAAGLIIVNTANVQAALAQLDAQVNTNTQNTKYTNDLIGNRPTPAVYGPGWYFARDDNGGTLYHSDGVAWTPQAKGLNWASGTQLAYGTINTISPAVTSTTASDVAPELTITVPASTVPVIIRGRILGQQATGATAAVGSFNQLALSLTDAANTSLDFDVLPAIQANLASHTWYKALSVMAVLPAPFAGGTFKLRTYLTAALASGWSATLLATGPTWPKAWIEAVAE